MTTEDYLALPYRVTLIPDRDEDGRSGWVAEIPDLPGCISQGDTPGEAVERVHDAMAGWISVTLEDGREIPPPTEERAYSGKFLVRLPASLHAELVRQAEREEVSLNQLVATALAGFVGWRATESDRIDPRTAPVRPYAPTVPTEGASRSRR
jgi:antitoxin HicB